MSNRDYEQSKNPYLIPRVVLSSISDEIQLDENYEPPFVRKRAANSNYVYIDLSIGSNPNTNPASRICKVDRGVPRINRLRLAYLAFRYYSANINPRNNVFTFTRVSTGITYTITLPEQNSLGLLRYTNLTAAMNTAVGLIVFTVGPNLVYPNTFDITDAGGPFYFDPNSIGVKNGRYLWGFNSTNTGISNANVGISLTYTSENYTRYIDIRSNELTQYSKLDPAGANLSDTVILRLDNINSILGRYETLLLPIEVSLNYDRSRSLDTIDIQLEDEFNQLLYIPQFAWGSFIFIISVVGEM